MRPRKPWPSPEAIAILGILQKGGAEKNNVYAKGLGISLPKYNGIVRRLRNEGYFTNKGASVTLDTKRLRLHVHCWVKITADSLQGRESVLKYLEALPNALHVFFGINLDVYAVLVAMHPAHLDGIRNNMFKNVGSEIKEIAITTLEHVKSTAQLPLDHLAGQ
jgi:DNA-binding Lrp family transcriptional regulator